MYGIFPEGLFLKESNLVAKICMQFLSFNMKEFGYDRKRILNL